MKKRNIRKILNKKEDINPPSRPPKYMENPLRKRKYEKNKYVKNSEPKRQFEKNKCEENSEPKREYEKKNPEKIMTKILNQKKKIAKRCIERTKNV